MNVILLLNNGAGAFPTSGAVFVSGPLADVATADIDRNGTSDLVVAINDAANPRIVTPLNNGVAVFGYSPDHTYALPAAPNDLAVADLNRDGAADVAVSLTSGLVCTFRNRTDLYGRLIPDGRFRLISGIPLRAADLNRDGRIDLIRAGVLGGNPALAWLANRTPFGANAPRLYESSPNLPIPDGPGGMLTSPPIRVPLAALVADLDVQIDIQHPYLGDLAVTLIHPSGAEVMLVPSSTRGFADYSATIFDDEAVHHLWAGNGPYTGRYRPVPPGRLATLYDRPALGDWRLRVADAAPTSSGTLLHWSLSVRTRIFDCNTNSIPDECDIDAGTSPDGNADRVPDECGLFVGDMDGDDDIDGDDIAAFVACLIAGSAAGPCAAADMDGDGDVDADDVTLFVAALLGL